MRKEGSKGAAEGTAVGKGVELVGGRKMLGSAAGGLRPPSLAWRRCPGQQLIRAEAAVYMAARLT